MIEFPKDFLWGAATSAYQVEGDNANCDWWEWEKRAGLAELSGQACRHYEFFREDFELARQLSHNAHRFSVEWSRIEPREGEFSESELSHYVEVVDALRKLNLEPIVTLHHFTNPLWFAASGGWQGKKAPAYFLRYVERVANALAGKVNYWVTINEPMVYAYHSYVLGAWPPQEKSFSKARAVENNFAASHAGAYNLIHRIYRQMGLKPPRVSIAKNMQAFMPCLPSSRNKFAAYLRDACFNFSLIRRLARQGTLDFIGVNYYTRSLIDVKGWRLRNLLTDTCQDSSLEPAKNSLGWEVYPEGLYALLLRLKGFGLPVVILENGICTEDDSLRWDFIRSHLEKAGLAMSEGVKLKGYIYWSLMDNFEWDKGFGPRFGLIGIDYRTYKRTVRESAKKYAEVCRSGSIA